jgi:hypothetical protein
MYFFLSYKQSSSTASTAGAGNYFRLRATLRHYLCLAGHIAVKKAYFQAKKNDRGGPDVARGPYVALYCSTRNTAKQSLVGLTLGGHSTKLRFYSCL